MNLSAASFLQYFTVLPSEGMNLDGYTMPEGTSGRAKGVTVTNSCVHKLHIATALLKIEHLYIEGSLENEDKGEHRSIDDVTQVRYISILPTNKI